MRRTPPDPEVFNATVWHITRQIPPGSVASYGQIAAMIPPQESVSPDEYRRLAPFWVGQALNQLPETSDVPWQRVLSAQGAISLPGAAAEQQRSRLKQEGVPFTEAGTVDLNQCGWDGPPDDWLQSHGLRRPPSLKKPGGDVHQPRLF